MSILLVFIMCISLCGMAAFADNSKYLSADDAAVALRNAMKERKTQTTIYYDMDYKVNYMTYLKYANDTSALMNALIADATQQLMAELDTLQTKIFMHTGDPCEGDYIFYQFLGFVPKVDISGCDISRVLSGKLGLKVDFTLSYRTTAEQEKQVDAKVAQILAALDLEGKTDFEKVKAIYDWMGANIVYDWDGLASYVTKPLASSAYAALFNGTAVCQGYSVLFYRLCLEEGIDARVVQDVTGGGAPHVWNIVQMDDGMYYYIDTTVGAGVQQVFDQSPYAYFLKGSDTWSKLAGYTLGDQYTNKTLYPDFANQFPVSVEDYSCPDTPDTPDTPDIPDVPDTGCDCAAHCNHVAAVAAGCEVGGNIEYWVCTECGTYYSDEACTESIAPESVTVLATGHSLKHIAKKSASAFSKGNVEYWKCDKCGTCFGDANGINVINQSDTVIPATGFTSIFTGIIKSISTIFGSIFRK